MAKQFERISDLMKYLETQIPINLEKIGEEVKSVLRFNLLNNWYRTYEPQYYERTDMLINSLEVSKAKRIGDSWQVSIFFNEEKILPSPASQSGFFPAHSNVTDGASSFNGMSYGELLPWWIEEGQHSSIHSYTGIHMVKDTIDWAKSDGYLKNRMCELLQRNGFVVI